VLGILTRCDFGIKTATAAATTTITTATTEKSIPY
jgi:hypothetical protein